MDTLSTGDPSALQCQDYDFSHVTTEGEGKQHNMKEREDQGGGEIIKCNLQTKTGIQNTNNGNTYSSCIPN